LSKNAGAKRAERNVDLAEQFGNEQIDLTATSASGPREDIDLATACDEESAALIKSPLPN
jgi:hypothetical protein